MIDIIIAAASDTGLADPSTAFADHQARIESLRPANKQTLFDVLAAAGITQTVVSFDGYGDSGQVEDITARSQDGEVPLPEVQVAIACPAWGCAHVETRRMTVADALEHLVYDCLAEAHPGWENSDGAFGSFTFDVAARTAPRPQQPLCRGRVSSQTF
ncbi:MAG: hypothetical protein U1E59_14335 [Amaricoccus sp.]